MYSLDLVKPDGRWLTLYSREPLTGSYAAPSPFSEPLYANPHLRWHPLRGEWVAYAAYRQGRTFLPPPEYNPLAPTSDPRHPTEVPGGAWDIAVFENRFPTFTPNADWPPPSIVETAPATGRCEVVVYTQEPATSLGRLPLAHIDVLLQVWADRTDRAAQLGAIKYVLPFENRGVEVGATLHHPHGQIYAYPVVPPHPANMQRQQVEHYTRQGTALLSDLIARELDADQRIIYRGQHAVAFVPVCARYPYEAWIAPLQPLAYFSDLDAAQRRDMARALKTLLLKYDGLWNRPFPYVMAWFQAPIDRAGHPEAHLHAEFYPPYRTRTKLKYLAGTEIAAGLFAMDALPEDKARELQAVEVSLE